MKHFTAGATLVLGGARSGKSAFAEQLADESSLQKIYLATSRVWDGEMEERIAIHRERRGPDWNVVEEPLALSAKLAELSNPETCILVDCLTLWLTNLMMADSDVKAECDRLVQTLSELQKENSLLFVSNEVGQGIVPVDKMAREFRDYAGKLHQDLAAIVSNVWFVTAGLQNRLK